MNLFQLVLLGARLIAQLAANPIFGLGKDGVRIGALVELLAKFGEAGDAAVAELKAFTDEIKAIIDSGARVDPAKWDELTARRHADADAIHAATVAGRGGGTG